MNYYFRAILLATIMQLIGCGATFKIERIQPIQEKIRSYDIGTPILTTIGSEMIFIKTRFTLPKYTPLFPFQPPAAAFSDMPKLMPGQVWVAYFGHDNLHIISSLDYANEIGIEINSNGQVVNKKPWIGLAPFIVNSSEDTVRMFQKEWNLPDQQLFKRDGVYLVDASYKIELVYGGRVNNNIKYVSKEYINDFHNVSKLQSYTHDLNSGNTFNYKSIKIQIDEATDSKITFKVLQDEGLSWMDIQF